MTVVKMLENYPQLTKLGVVTAFAWRPLAVFRWQPASCAAWLHLCRCGYLLGMVRSAVFLKATLIKLKFRTPH